MGSGIFIWICLVLVLSLSHRVHAGLPADEEPIGNLNTVVESITDAGTNVTANNATTNATDAAASSSNGPETTSTSPSTASVTTVATTEAATVTTQAGATKAPTTAQAAPLTSTNATATGIAADPDQTSSNSSTSSIAQDIAESAVKADDLLEFVGEFEDKLDDPNHPFMRFRSDASANRSLHLVSDDDKLFEMKLCIKPLDPLKPVALRLMDIVYSNDGPSDDIIAKLNGTTFGNATTSAVSNYGDEWNVFKSTGPIGEAQDLDEGTHTLTIGVKTDQYGVELDKADFTARNQDPTVKPLCDAKLVDLSGVVV